MVTRIQKEYNDLHPGSLVSVRLLLGSEGYGGEWRHTTPPPGGLKGSGGWEEKKKRRLGRRDSRAGRLTGAQSLLIKGKERCDITSFASDVTECHHPVMSQLPL